MSTKTVTVSQGIFPFRVEKEYDFIVFLTKTIARKPLQWGMNGIRLKYKFKLRSLSESLRFGLDAKSDKAPKRESRPRTSLRGRG